MNHRTNTTRNCEECGTIIKGRSDKRFCDDHCRSAYNYRSARKENQELQRVHKQLKRNRKILKLFWDAGQREVLVQLLKLNGFEFDYITRIKHGVRDQIIYSCYEFSYYFIDERKVKLQV
jgi:predicted nucleic acid-binding Zn ribbon protein